MIGKRKATIRPSSSKRTKTALPETIKNTDKLSAVAATKPLIKCFGMRDIYGKDCTLGPYASDGWKVNMTQAAPGMADTAEGSEDEGRKIRGKTKE